MHEDTFDACYMVIFYAQNVKPQTIIHCERTRGEKTIGERKKKKLERWVMFVKHLNITYVVHLNHTFFGTFRVITFLTAML